MFPFDPFTEFDALRRDIDRALDAVRRGSRNPLGFLPGQNPRSYPLLNMTGDNDALHVEAVAPGLNPETLDVSVERNQLTISGEKTGIPSEVARENVHRSERAAGKFVRTLTLPVEIDESKVSAEYKNGVLRVHLPKAEKAKPRQITVAVA